MSAPQGRLAAFGPQRLRGLLRTIAKAETALWAPALLVAALTLTDYAVALRAEADLRVAASRAAVALGMGRVDAPEAAAMVQRELQGRAPEDLSISVSLSDRAAVEVRLSAREATLFGFHWFLPEDPISVRAEAAMMGPTLDAELVRRGGEPG
ncbi:hypothetical protein [Albimonas pacifica]|uniref:Uncharacterized protein n=1 Tax=Albimonas pacifica TaxID=1114924 RepID=A0A1I3GPR7_9RHOB|nr:hypothetical protein [Albimonas pacifica]SFI25339.1 hypothetical protein SAMN05216258_105273 [Albimonas pacifica]